jgi:hypothetical protein
MIVVTWGDDVRNFKLLNSVIMNANDCGHECVGGLDQASFTGNYFFNCDCSMGGWFDTQRGGAWVLTNSLFQNNVMQATPGVPNTLFVFSYDVANNDADANSKWGGAGNGATR